MDQWEYAIRRFAATGFTSHGGKRDSDVLLELNRLGAEGWDAVTVSEFARAGATHEIAVLLKRRLQ